MNESDETLQIFFAETDDLMRLAEESLLRLEANPRPGPEVQEIFRAIHTMKSGSAMVGFATVSEYSHLLENLLERVRSGQLPITKPLVSFLLEDVDFLRKMVDRGARGQLEAEPEVLRARKAQLNRFLGMEAVMEPEEPPKPKPKPEATKPKPEAKPKGEAKPVKQEAKAKDSDGKRYYEIDLKFRKDIFASGQDPLLLLLGLEEVAEIVDVVADMSRLPPYESLDPYTLYISWRLVVKTPASPEELDDVFLFVKDDNEISIEDITARYKEGVDMAVGERPLGEVLMERGAISKNDLSSALGKQKRLGEILVEDGKIDPTTLQQLVVQQEESRKTYRKTSVRVDVEKINHLVNLAEEIGIGLSRFQNAFDAMPSMTGTEAGQELENLLKVNREFQERVAQVRMFPLEGTFRRFQRIARDTAFEQDKRVRVTLMGMDTELDKEVIEHITDPLKHLVRNCVDHGIETPEEREAANKPAEGVIVFRAFQKGGMILVQISDDGRGLDLERIAQRAVEREIIAPGETVDSSNVLDIICRPGFSTANTITALSGRGVGMDVVRNEVEQLGGTMQIETELGRGTTFTLSLPLTFALTEALHVRDRERSYLIPLWGVVGTGEFDPSMVRFFGGGQRLYMFRGEYVPVVQLSKVYGYTEENLDPGAKAGTIMVFIDTSRQRFGLVVDQVLDPHQVVVKSLESNFKSVEGIAGATIMGDGSVALVMDLFALEDMFFKKSSARSDA